jgi:hypothetical protein
MRPQGRTLLLAALIAVAVLVLHELRYLIGYGSDAAEVLSLQGHGYLPSAAVVVALLLALGMGQLLLAFRRALQSATASPAPPFGLLWLASVSALLTVYCGQELLEGFLSAGHPNGLAALAAEQGWSAVPLAIVLGGLVALTLRGAAAAEARMAAHARRERALRGRPPRLRRNRPDAEQAPIPVLAAKLAGRAPPLLVRTG